MHKFYNILILICIFSEIKSQEKGVKEPFFTLMFYNTENLFDCFDDPITDDNEFLPTSKRHWTRERYQDKLNKLSKVILSASIDPPSFIGMSEVENYFVLDNLIKKTSLEKFNYKIIHYDSPDPRGIDVAAIYRADKLKILSSKAIRIHFKSNPKRKTRDILYIKGIIEKDTVHFFVNHWPSRRGGKKASDLNRKIAAQYLKNNIDSIERTSPQAKIIVTGDFNDEPDDKSICDVLKAHAPQTEINKNQNLINLSFRWLIESSYIGTHHFKGRWGILDQIIISPSLLRKKKQGSIYCNLNSAKIHNASFLLLEDKTFGGNTTFRTYSGFKYTAGFSDHLPVLLELFLLEK